MKISSELSIRLRGEERMWLVTGAAGFIGSNLVEALLELDQRVVGFDNFSTGHRRNLDEVRALVSNESWSRFAFVEGDIHDAVTCRKACEDVDYVLHQAALGSVPRSIADPMASHESNVTGFLNMLMAARDAEVKRFIYASSSSVYGDHPDLPKVEGQTGNCLSPYAVTKKTNELYAEVFSRCYGIPCVGLRYFNVFGPRQDPNGPYAAVIPKWIAAMIHQEPVYIYGDGETTRDFCYVANAVQANVLAALTDNTGAVGEIYNVSIGERTTLNQLFQMLRRRLVSRYRHLEHFTPLYSPFRKGDVFHSQADISKARRMLGYEPSHRIEAGLDEALDWYVGNLAENGANGRKHRNKASK